MKSSVYFYACGQRARALGWSKAVAEDFYCTGAATRDAWHYFDRGFRGMSHKN